MNILEDFDITVERGFLPKEDPLKSFVGSGKMNIGYMGAFKLEQFAINIPKFLASGTLRKEVNNLAPNDFTPAFELYGGLEADSEYRRAMMLLSFIGHAYLWGGEEPATRIPASIAKPWEYVAKHLGRPPILSYVSYAHDNWYRIDKSQGITLDNIALLQNFLGGVDEEWFTMIHIAMEAQAGPAAAGAVCAIEAAKEKDIKAVDDALLEIAASLGNMYRTFCRMPEKCDPYIYYTRVRPYIAGTKNNPLTPNGIIYSGTDNEEPRFYRGETGAQHSLIPALDGTLGVVHKKGVLKDYLMEMREYMPPKHRAFIEYCETESTVRKLVNKNKSLIDSYNLCLTWIEKFRTKHLEYANTYIHQQSQNKSSVGSGGSTTIGTGGTPFMEYLTKHRDETTETKK